MKKTWHGVLPSRGDADISVSTLLPSVAAYLSNYDGSIQYSAHCGRRVEIKLLALLLLYCMWGKTTREGSASRIRHFIHTAMIM
jgi:hypothetical protein